MTRADAWKSPLLLTLAGLLLWATTACGGASTPRHTAGPDESVLTPATTAEPVLLPTTLPISAAAIALVEGQELSVAIPPVEPSETESSAPPPESDVAAEIVPPPPELRTTMRRLLRFRR